MERWTGKVAVVTGASAGVGLAIAQSLVKAGLKVVGLARRKEKMEQEFAEIEGPGEFFARPCDITDESQVDEAFDWIENDLGTVNILINNAGTLVRGSFEDLANEDFRKVVNLNILGLTYCSKRAIRMMRANGEEANIININSFLGHSVPDNSDFNIYGPTKFAVTALSQVLANELRGSKIRVSNVSLGLVKTERTLADDFQNIITVLPALEPEDIANSVLYVISVPMHVNITELSIGPAV